MRAWTLGFSIACHVCLIAGVIVAPLFATTDLPTPPRATEFVRVIARLPPDPPRARRQATPVRPSTAAAPLEPPDDVRPEPQTVVSPSGVIDTSIAGGGNTIGNGLLASGDVSGDPLTPPPPPPRPSEPIRVGGLVRPPTKVAHVTPRYPAVALSARIQGLVILDAVIDVDGGVRDVRTLRSPSPLLEAAAIEAVRQWRFTPTLLNGEAVPIVMTVTVSFSLP